ncbi:MAG: dienelactone hydrolase family protein [Bacteroidota bacterium]|nr:dienelactone hydrolase family protein [Bacteroidota bacterium]
MEYRFYDEVLIPVRGVELKGELIIPQRAKAIVIFSHGTGSSRLSPRNQKVAQQLHQHHFGTLLLDLLSEKEDANYANRFNIELLTRRLAGATEWLEEQKAAKECSIGYFGASTGAASALRAASYMPQVKAVVSRGGRPDLAEAYLSDVECPTLLIVGSLDVDVLQLNETAFEKLNCEKKIKIIEGATHLFEEKGMLDKVAELATSWFEKYLLKIHVT